MIDSFLKRLPFLSGSKPLEEGEEVPSFRTFNQDEEHVSSDQLDYAVLYFYPRASTPGCTKEACNFRDEIQKLNDLGVEVYGISTDSIEAQKKFHDEEELNFDLLADFEQELSRKFGVLTKAGFAERTTFIVKDGEVVKRFRKVDPEEHVQEVVDYLSE